MVLNVFREELKTSTFVENDNKAVLAILKKNLNNLKIEKKSEVFNGKIISFLNKNRNKYEISFFLIHRLQKKFLSMRLG